MSVCVCSSFLACDKMNIVFQFLFSIFVTSSALGHRSVA